MFIIRGSIILAHTMYYTFTTLVPRLKRSASKARGEIFLDTISHL